MDGNRYEYNEKFYDYISEGSAQSARIIIPIFLGQLPQPVSSVLDVGCGAGAWLSAWKEHGCRVLGLDGDHVNRDMLMIDTHEFQVQDLSRPFSLGKRFDLVQCVEVAEHLPESSAPLLVNTLCSHSDLILFSAAVPGQGGENHINEKPYSFWRDLFDANAYQMYDPLRGQLIENNKVKSWYQYNLFLFVNRNRLQDTHTAIADFLVERDSIPKDLSPLSYRIRKGFVRLLSFRAQTMLAILKKYYFNAVGRV